MLPGIHSLVLCLKIWKLKRYNVEITGPGTTHFTWWCLKEWCEVVVTTGDREDDCSNLTFIEQYPLVIRSIIQVHLGCGV